MEHYKNAPQKLRDELSSLLAELEETIAQEVESAFTTIIANNINLTLYSLGLYYHGWGYILPTFSSEEGLQQVAKNYAEGVKENIELEKKSLRWSPCDSPHHGEEELESMMPKTESLLKELSSIIDFSDPRHQQYQWSQAYQNDENLYRNFISELYHKFEGLVVSALNKIWENKHLNDFFVINDCALTLNASDISHEDFLEHAKKLNNEKVIQKLIEDIKDSHEAGEALFNMDID